MEHLITVKLVVNAEGKEKVVAEPNPLPGVEPGDIVVWMLAPSTDGRALRVEFEEVWTLGPDGKEVDPKARIKPLEPAARPCLGPNSESGRIIGVVKADVARGKRFVYKVMDDGGQLAWGNPMLGTENFGGMDVPAPPPRG